MHILLFPSWYPKNSSDVSGVFFRDQALALQRHGHKVGVIYLEKKSLRTLYSKKKGSCQNYELDNGMPTYRNEVMAAMLRFQAGNFLLLKWAAMKLFKRYIKKHGKPDIIHAHSAIYGGAIAVHIGKKWDIPVVLTEHSSGFSRKLYNQWQLKIITQTVKRTASCIAVSPSLCKLLSQELTESDVSWKWIPNVVAERFNLPRQHERSLPPLRYLNLAVMTEKKGQLDLIKAFKLLLDNGVDAELWLGGDGPIRSALEELAEELNISCNVRFLGLIPPGQVPELFNQVDVMVISSHYETFGVVAAEALTAGLPVIATRCGGPECIVLEEDGLLVEPKQPKAMASAMLDMGRNLDRYDSEDLSLRAKQRFSAPAVASELTYEYERVLAKYRAKSSCSV